MKNGQECSPQSPVNMITHLPDDLLLNCLARVSRLYYPILSLVSKKFRSLIASLELYQTRTLLGHSESCLYVYLGFSNDSKLDPRWFTLCQRPTRIHSPNPNLGWLTPCFGLRKILTKRLSNNLMVPVPTSNFSAVYLPYGAIGSNIYSIVEYVHGEFSTWDRVFYLDCRSHTSHKAPRMWMIRSSPPIRVLDGKLYVLEQWSGFPSNLIEIFDPKTQLWDYVRCPIAEILGTRSSLISFAIDGGFYLYGDKCMVYKPKENKWDVVEYETGLVWASFRLSCVINNVVYSSKLSRVLKWYDSEGRLWRDLKGLDKLPKLPKSFSRLRLVNYGGKIAVLCGGVSSREKKMIWCAVIAVERRSGQEIYGKIEWCEVVLTVPKSCCLLEFFAVTV
ncbi:unnamed protein product [Brassica rapa subsp. narinosa]